MDGRYKQANTGLASLEAEEPVKIHSLDIKAIAAGIYGVFATLGRVPRILHRLSHLIYLAATQWNNMQKSEHSQGCTFPKTCLKVTLAWLDFGNVVFRTSGRILPL